VTVKAASKDTKKFVQLKQPQLKPKFNKPSLNDCICQSLYWPACYDSNCIPFAKMGQGRKFDSYCSGWCLTQEPNAV